MASKIELECTDCGHVWMGKPLEERATEPRCSECGATGSTIEALEETQESADEPEETETESFESEPEEIQQETSGPPPAPEGPPQQQQKRAPRRQRTTPPHPDEYASQTADEPQVLSPREVFRDVIEMFPDYGSKANKNDVTEYLEDMADYHGTPTPDDLYDWVVRFNGVSESVADDLREQYDYTLDHQLQRGKLDRGEVMELFGFGTPADQADGPEGARSGPRGSRTAARLDGPQSATNGAQPGRRPVESRAKMRAAEEAASRDVPQPVEDRLARADVPPGVKDLAREMYVLGRDAAQEQQSSQPHEPRRREPSPQQPAPRQQPQHEQSTSSGGGGDDLVDAVDKVVTLEEKLREFREGDSNAADEELARLQNQVNQMYQVMQQDSVDSSDAAGELEQLVINADLPIEEKKELLGSATKDAETVKLERRYDRLERLLDKGEEVVKGAMSTDENGRSFMWHIGQLRAGLRDAAEGEPERRQERRRQPQGERRRQPEERPPEDDIGGVPQSGGRQPREPAPRDEGVQVQRRESSGRAALESVREERVDERPPPEEPAAEPERVEPEPEEYEDEEGEYVCPGCGRDDFDSKNARDGHLASCPEYQPEDSGPREETGDV